MKKIKIGKYKIAAEKITIFVLGIIFSTSVTVLAETCQTTLSSANITYDNTTAEAEVNSLLTQAGNIDSRVTTLEAKDYAKRLTGEKVETRTDSEGGNIYLVSKSGTYYSEMDMYNNTTWRIYHGQVEGNATGFITHSYNKTANLDYLDGVTSNIQTQLDAKAASSGYTANRVMVSNGSGALAVSGSIDTTELGYLNGVTSNIQTQLGNKLNSSDLLGKTYPVGAIYISAVATSPATLFGGTWTQLKNRFLFATNATSGAKGKDSVSTLTGTNVSGTAITINQMPSHTHTQNAHSHLIGLTGAGSGGFSGWALSVGASNVTSVNTVSTTSTTATNQNTGGGQTHNHSVSYIEVYVWQRTA